jgi:hypothetical protein
VLPKLRWIIFLSGLTLTGFLMEAGQRHVGPATTSEPSSSGIHVLFIGNSFTYCEYMPQMVGALAKAGHQRPFRFEMQTPAGCTLEKHWNDGLAVKKIRSREWDVVVLQEQSQRPLAKPDLMFDYGKILAEEIQRQGARTVLFVTFANRHKRQDQAAITNAYLKLSKDIDAEVAPVGNAWEMALSEHDQLVLHDADDSHPNAIGAYLTACVMYATIYGESPEGLPGWIGNISDAEARVLQSIAWRSVQESNQPSSNRHQHRRSQAAAATTGTSNL